MAQLNRIFFLAVFFLCSSSFAFCKQTRIRELGRYPNQTNLVNRAKAISNVDEADEPLTVYASVYVETLSNFQTGRMSFDLDLYLRLTWINQKLKHNHDKPILLETEEELKYFWVPDLYFSNARIAKFQDVLKPNAFMRIYKNGEVAYSSRVTLTASCSQDLRNYPMDTQQCGLYIKSYSHSTDRLIVKWREDRPILGRRSIHLPEMKVERYFTEQCDDFYQYAETDSYYMKANFSCIFAGVQLSREIGYHVVQTFIPTALIVVVSWISFFIDPFSVPARISLAFTTLLTLSTMAAGVRVSLPLVAYAKAIDVWIGVCMLLVFAALAEFAVVYSYAKGATSLERKITNKGSLLKESQSLTDMDDMDRPSSTLIAMARRKKSIANRIDNVCRFVFPISFALFNLVYWTVYTRR